MNKLAVFGAGAALLLAAAPASAVTTFANFSPASNGFNVHYAGALDGSGTITSVDQLVHFTFLNTDGSPGGTTFDAKMNLTATTGAGSDDSDDTATGMLRASRNHARFASVPARKML